MYQNKVTHNIYENIVDTGFTSSFHIVINVMLSEDVVTVIIGRL